jgi:hypothetical protein
MSEQPDRAGKPGADATSEIAQLLDQIRGDTRWREEVAAARAPAAPQTTPPSVEPMLTPQAPPPGPALGAAFEAMGAAIRAVDAPIPLDPATPVVGEAMAAFRRRVHAEIRIAQDRQTAVNYAIVAALESLVRHLDPASASSPVGALWNAAGEMAAAVTDLRRQLAALEAQLERLTALERANEMATLEMEPLGQVRVALAELEARLTALEGGS